MHRVIGRSARCLSGLWPRSATTVAWTGRCCSSVDEVSHGADRSFLILGLRASMAARHLGNARPGPSGGAHAHVCFDPFHLVKVRHEALLVRAGCKTPSPGCRGSPVKLRTA
jgi:hypothetical protein